jgi:prepilin-type N-terminal cleavage/methylation domain-containing protein
LPNNDGFTLTELAIVLVIVALLVGGMLVPLTAQREIQNTIETQKQLADIRDALIGFAAANGRLPRPATSLADGTEKAVPCGVNNDVACTGFIPWTTLGVKKSDAWNKLIGYSVTPAYTDSQITLNSTGSKRVQTRDKTGALSDLIGSANCLTNGPCAAVVIFSAGKNNWGTSEDGIAFPNESSNNADETTNASATFSFIARSPGTVAGGGEFDDIVVWISPNLLFSRLLAAGRLP